jgi:hypothetical protein
MSMSDEMIKDIYLKIANKIVKFFNFLMLKMKKLKFFVFKEIPLSRY